MDNKELDVVNNTENGTDNSTPNEVDNSANEVVTTTTNATESSTNEEASVIADAPMENEMLTSSFESDFKEEGNNDTSSKYNITLLLNYFLGTIGLHRIINGKKASGITMAIITLLVLPIFVTLLWLGLVNDNSLLIVLGMFTAPISLAISVIVIIDFFMIILGKFKNKDNVAIKSNKPFFKNWVHFLIIGCMILSMISSIVFGVTFSGSILESFDDSDGKKVTEKDKDKDEDKDKDKGKSSSGSVEKSMEAFENCLNGEGDDITFEDADEFMDGVEEHFESLDYNSSIEDDYAIFSKKDGNLTITVYVSIEEVKGITYLDMCSVGISDKTNNIYTDVEFYASTDYPTDEIEYDISTSDYADDEYTLYGTYYADNDEYELSDLYTDEEYDFDKDELGLVKKFSDLISRLEKEKKEMLEY